MEKFLSAALLKNNYKVVGNFYEVLLPPVETSIGKSVGRSIGRSIGLPPAPNILCRNLLEIRSRQTPFDEKNQTDQIPNVVAILMNPGGSQPLETPKLPTLFDSVNNRDSQLAEPISDSAPAVALAGILPSQLAQLPKKLVPTRPDTTQYQLMRLMHFFDWQFVRVINLSDLREPKSPIFMARWQELERQFDFLGHSIFAEQRRAELRDRLALETDSSQKSLTQAPLILCAWGVSDALNPLILRAWTALQELNVPLSSVLGLRKVVPNSIENVVNDPIPKFFHPLPTLQSDKEKWFHEMVQQISAVV